MNESIHYVEYLRSIVKPQDLMYIAIDGVCPRAKMVQQRKRRYISSMRKRLVENNQDYQKGMNLEWNSNTITPGTAFMNNFDAKIQAFYKGDQKVIVSGSIDFGEGEHKIYNYIKENENGRENDIIYGLDADLILLSMLNLKENDTLRLFREAPEFGGIQGGGKGNSNDADEFCLLSMNRLITAIESYYRVDPRVPRGQFMRDYIILCTFLGNDFLPPLSYIKVKDNGIDYIIQTYQTIVDASMKKMDDDHYLVNEDGVINDTLLLTLLQAFSLTEDENMSNACKHYFSRRVPYCHLQSYQRTFWELDHYPSLHKMKQTTIDCDKKGWRTQYYNSLFGKDLVVTDLCQNYLEGLKWVVDYYVRQTPLLDWSYLYSYSPTILDLKNHIQFEMHRNKLDDILDIAMSRSSLLSNETFKHMMASGSLQLLLVLPPCSKDLIPDKRHAKIMTELSSGCLHLFPTNFKITTFLKSFIWECSAILPDIDIMYMYRCLNGCQSVL